MATSEARLLANRQNSARSTGPTSTSGKERSRRNGLKHGMTGSGVVIPEEDAAEVERRNDALRKELAPKSVIGAILVQQLATLSVRMERGVRQEFAAVAARVRHAADDFDEARLERAERLFEAIGDDPRGNVRRLRKMPEGVDLLLRAWRELRADLVRVPRPVWTASHMVRAANLLEIGEEKARESRVGVLSRAAWCDFEGLAEHEGAGLDEQARRAWARDELVEGIDSEIADLEAHAETLDREGIELDRAGAADIALFDPSKEAGLARRYESEARREFFRAMKEFRRAEDEAAERAASEPPTEVPPTVQPDAPLASSCDRPSPESDGPEPSPLARSPEPVRPVERPVPGSVEAVQGVDGPPSTVPQAAPSPA